jgi:hypothetical protein
MLGFNFILPPVILLKDGRHEARRREREAGDAQK